MKTAKTKKKTLITLNQQLKEIPKWNTLAIVQPKNRSSNKKIVCKNSGQYSYHLIIQNIG